MFERLFGKPDRARQEEDRVWLTDAARMKGLCREADLALEGGGHSVVVVALAAATLDSLAEALSRHTPLRCADVFERDNLRRRLAEGGSLVLATPAALPADLKPEPDGPPVDILVLGRNPSRATDDSILRFAEQLGTRATVAFHLSLDDPLLHEHTQRLRPLLEKLGMSAEEPISHPWVARAIAKAQSK